MAKELLHCHDPGLEIPPFSPEAEVFLNRYIYLRQWLSRTSPPSSANNGYADIWLHYDSEDPERRQIINKYNTSPAWNIFHVMYSIASGAFSPIENPLPHPRVIRVVEGAGSDFLRNMCQPQVYLCFISGSQRKDSDSDKGSHRL
jgi:hypothetical protein